MARKKKDVMIALDERSSVPLYEQIYSQIRSAILNDGIAAGDWLPSIRALQKQTGVSHTTIEHAYLQLTVEGYVRNVPYAGYVVENIDTGFLHETAPSDLTAQVEEVIASHQPDDFYAENTQGATARYDFSYANLPIDSFPTALWRRLTNEVLCRDTIPALTRYQSGATRSSLQHQIAQHLQRARHVSCIDDQVVVRAGTDDALSAVLAMLPESERIIGIEEPGYATTAAVARRFRYEIEPLPVLEGTDRFLESVRKSKAHLLFITPSHQFPTGNHLALETRVELLKLAVERELYLIEDDSCSEYRYDTAPIPALAGLDAHGRVIYLGNVSKVLSPSLRIAYLVLPPELLRRYYDTFGSDKQMAPWLEQEVLARFMEQGHWDRHVRKMSTQLSKRHNALLESLTEAFDDQLDLRGKQSGMHLFATVKNGMTQQELLDSAAAQGAKVYGTKRMWHSSAAPENQVMIGFSSIGIKDIPTGVTALARAWHGK